MTFGYADATLPRGGNLTCFGLTLIWISVICGAFASPLRQETKAGNADNYIPAVDLSVRDEIVARAVTVTPTNSSIPGYTYAGCYSNINPSVLGTLLGSPQYLLGGRSYASSTGMTWATCSAYCATYQYAGLFSGSSCACADSFAFPTTPVSDVLCSSACTGNIAQSCGGTDKVTVFRNSNYGVVAAVSSVAPVVSTNTLSSKPATGLQPATVALSNIKLASSLVPAVDPTSSPTSAPMSSVSQPTQAFSTAIVPLVASPSTFVLGSSITSSRSSSAAAIQAVPIPSSSLLQAVGSPLIAVQSSAFPPATLLAAPSVGTQLIAPAGASLSISNVQAITQISANIPLASATIAQSSVPAVAAVVSTLSSPNVAGNSAAVSSLLKVEPSVVSPPATDSTGLIALVNFILPIPQSTKVPSSALIAPAIPSSATSIVPAQTPVVLPPGVDTIASSAAAIAVNNFVLPSLAVVSLSATSKISTFLIAPLSTLLTIPTTASNPAVTPGSVSTLSALNVVPAVQVPPFVPNPPLVPSSVPSALAASSILPVDPSASSSLLLASSVVSTALVNSPSPLNIFAPLVPVVSPILAPILSLLAIPTPSLPAAAITSVQSVGLPTQAVPAINVPSVVVSVPPVASALSVPVKSPLLGALASLVPAISVPGINLPFVLPSASIGPQLSSIPAQQAVSSIVTLPSISLPVPVQPTVSAATQQAVQSVAAVLSLNLPLSPPVIAAVTSLLQQLVPTIAAPPSVNVLSIPTVSGSLPFATVPAASLPTSLPALLSVPAQYAPPSLATLPPVDLPLSLPALPVLSSPTQQLFPTNVILPSILSQIAVPSVDNFLPVAAIPSASLPLFIPVVPLVPTVATLPSLNSLLSIPKASVDTKFPAIPSAGSPLSIAASLVVPSLLQQLVSTAVALPSVEIPLVVPPVVQVPTSPTQQIVASIVAVPSINVPQSLPTIAAVSSITPSPILDTPSNIFTVAGTPPIQSIIPILPPTLLPTLPAVAVPTTLPTAPPSTPLGDVIKSGRILDKVYSWSFLYSGVAQVNSSIIDPATEIFAVRLPNGVLVGLFRDGLHVGEVRIPYPDEFAALLSDYVLPTYAPALTR